MPKRTLDKIVCPGCAWVGEVDKLDNGACPKCKYENGVEPFRLLTLKEILLDDNAGYNDVALGRFLQMALKNCLVQESREQFW